MMELLFLLTNSGEAFFVDWSARSASLRFPIGWDFCSGCSSPMETTLDMVGLFLGYLVVSPDLLESCFGSSMATDEWVAGVRSLTADVLVSRISCGLPMRGVGFLVRKEEEDGGSMIWRMMTKIGEQHWQLGASLFSFAQAEGGPDSPLMGIFSGLVTSSAAAGSARSIDFVGAAGSVLFQVLDGDGRCTPEGRWLAATSWRSLSTSWLSSCPWRGALSLALEEPVGVRCPEDLLQDPRIYISNLNFLRVLYVSLNHWRMYAEDLFVFYTSSRVLVVRALLF